MQKKSINPLLLIGMIGFFTIGSPFLVDIIRAFYGEENIHWTHMEQQLPLEEAKDNFEVFIHGKRLQQHLTEETLYTLDEDGMGHLVLNKEITARVNNWPQVKARILSKTIFTSFAFGVTLTLLITGLIQVFMQKKQRAQEGKDS